MTGESRVELIAKVMQSQNPHLLIRNLDYTASELRKITFSNSPGTIAARADLICKDKFTKSYTISRLLKDFGAVSESDHLRRNSRPFMSRIRTDLVN